MAGLRIEGCGLKSWPGLLEPQLSVKFSAVSQLRFKISALFSSKSSALALALANRNAFNSKLN